MIYKTQVGLHNNMLNTKILKPKVVDAIFEKQKSINSTSYKPILLKFEELAHNDLLNTNV